MKKLICILGILSLLFSLSLTAGAQETILYVDDQADILTSEEEEKLADLARKASHKVHTGIYIVTVEDYTELGYGEDLYIEPLLVRYFSDQNYGMGEDKSGVILMLSMADRDYSLYTHGFGDTGLSDPAMDHLTEVFLRDFSHDSWYNGFKHYISCTEDLLEMTIDGHPYNEFTASPFEKGVGSAVSFVIALLISWGITAHYVGQLKTVALETDASDFAGNLSLRVRNDRYVNTTTARVYDPPSSSGSSGGGRSSGGGGGCSRSGKF